ncbi:MAG TPA: tripartite tricarboxylate transporter substrate-binding protein [Telluria sp.]|nr:tripartite tricarboxylate transporter substrate-binding protein [Telluria sp.]
MDLTCKLAVKALHGRAGGQMRLSYLPGGIGAVAWHTLVSQRASEANTVVAFSGGSLLNLAQGKFGNVSAADVRWVAALGADYGMIAVRADSQYRTLADLIEALRRTPQKVLIGVSGTIGSQDWMKMALVAQRAGIDPKVLRFVALEGGGESFTAMDANFVQVVSGDASEATLYSGGGKVRVLAVLSEKRLPGALAAVPTAREQGIDVIWPIIRGVLMGPQVSDADYQRWVQDFAQVEASPDFSRLRASYGLYPFSMTGPAFTEYVKLAVGEYRRQAMQFKLVR